MNEKLENFIDLILSKPFKLQVLVLFSIVTVVSLLLISNYNKKVIGSIKEEIEKAESQNSSLSNRLSSLEQEISGFQFLDGTINQKENIINTLQREITGLRRSLGQRRTQMDIATTHSEIFTRLSGTNKFEVRLQSIRILPVSQLSDIQKQGFQIEMIMKYRDLIPYFKHLEESLFWITPTKVTINSVSRETDRIAGENSVRISLTATVYSSGKPTIKDTKEPVLISTEEQILSFDRPVTEERVQRTEQRETSTLIYEIPDFKVSKVFLSESGFLSIIINDKVFSENDRINNWIIKKINTNYIIFQKGIFTYTYTIKER